MNPEFFARKIKELTDEKLLELLRLGNDVNTEIIELATAEAQARGLSIPERVSSPTTDEPVQADRHKLLKWNWGAFFLAPFWTLANKLDKWAILTFIPGVNIFAHIYLGLNGNVIAYEKSPIRNIDDFMTLQKLWSTWGVRIFWISAGLTLLFWSVS